MKNVLVRYKVKAEQAEENVRLVKDVYAELKEKQPEGLRYTTLVAEDGVTFFHLASISAEGNPLMQVEAFGRFQQGIKERCDEPPAPEPVSLVGAYGFFDE